MVSGAGVVAVCGEAVVDLVPSEPQAQRYDARPGGSPANTAVAVARLGTPVTMLARLSGDGFGQLLRDHLTSNGVDLTLAVTATQPSSLAVVAVAADGCADYRFLVDGTADWAWTDDELARLPDNVVALHTGSLALALPPGGAAIERLLERERAGVTVSVDPNIRPALLDDPVATHAAVRRWVRLADIVKVSSDDLAYLHPGEDPIAVAHRWVADGPALVVVTMGGDGCAGVTARDVVTKPAIPLRVVDTVGAGDAFAGGLLDWLYRAGRLGGRLDPLAVEDLSSALDHAGRVAAITCGRAGADPAYRDELTAGPGGISRGSPGRAGWGHD